MLFVFNDGHHVRSDNTSGIKLLLCLAWETGNSTSLTLSNHHFCPWVLSERRVKKLRQITCHSSWQPRKQTKKKIGCGRLFTEAPCHIANSWDLVSWTGLDSLDRVSFIFPVVAGNLSFIQNRVKLAPNLCSYNPSITFTSPETDTYTNNQSYLLISSSKPNVSPYIFLLKCHFYMSKMWGHNIPAEIKGNDVRILQGQLKKL